VKKRLIQSLTIIAFCISTYQYSHSKSVWTYYDCVDYAFKHNIENQIKNIDVKQQDLKYNSAVMSYIPNISAGTNYNITNGRSVNPETNEITEKSYFSNSYSINTSYTLFDGFKKYNKLQFEDYNTKYVKNSYNKYRNELSYTIAELYGKLLLNQGLSNIYKIQYKNSTKEYKRKKELYKLGRIAKAELLESKARLSADSYLKIYNKNLAKISEIQLKKIMNFPTDSSLIVSSEINKEIILNDTTDLFGNAKRKLPEVQALEAQLKASESQLKLAYANLLPRLNAEFRINTGYHETKRDAEGNTMAFSDQISNNRNIVYGVNLSIPISSLFHSANNIKVAKLMKEKQELSLKLKLKNLEYEINEAKISILASKEEYLSALESRNSYEIASEVAEKKMDKGLISTLDYYESINNLAKSESEVLRTKIQLFLKSITIKYYLTGQIGVQ
jgi:outer membrane protein TolC